MIKAAMPDHLIFIQTETLTDNSEVYNVIFGDIEIPVITESDADSMAGKIVDAINEHSNDLADVLR